MLLNCRTLLSVLEADEVGHGVAQAGLGEGPAEENGQLSLVEISRDCALIGWIMMMLTPALLCHKDTAQGNPKPPTIAFHCVLMA